MRISDWSSDVCSSDLHLPDPDPEFFRRNDFVGAAFEFSEVHGQIGRPMTTVENRKALRIFACNDPKTVFPYALSSRSEEHTSELQSLMRISYAVFCLKKKNNTKTTQKNIMNNPTTKH